MLNTTTANGNTVVTKTPPAQSRQINNGLEEKVARYKKTAIDNIKFSVFIKPALISFTALILSFFLDLSYVPFLGNISVTLAQELFPTWQPASETIAPYSFWWLPVIVYGIFILIAYGAYRKLKKDVIRTPTTETIDRIVSSYTGIIDSISTALPLIGAALLLISIKLGEEVFLGLSVPFEVKALIVLALGKLFEPVLDQLSLEFQNVTSNVHNMRERYYSKLQIRNSRDIVKQLSQKNTPVDYSKMQAIPVKEMETYKDLLQQTSQLSEVILKNFTAVHTIIDKINHNQNINPEQLQKIKEVADSVSHAAGSLSDEKTVTGLKYLESIVKK